MVVKINNKFYELPEEKQLRIINAGFKVFGNNDYNKASTEEIACEAGISKGLLFYYFHNKKEFYQYLFDYYMKTVTNQLIDDRFNNITDFFELLTYYTEKEYSILAINPHLMDFIMRYYYSQKESVSENNNKIIVDYTYNMMDIYFKNVDFSKFKDDISPKDIFNMIFYMSDGYLHQMQKALDNIDKDKSINDFKRYYSLLKEIAYKEEFQ